MQKMAYVLLRNGNVTSEMRPGLSGRLQPGGLKMTEEFGFMLDGSEGYSGKGRHSAVDGLMVGRSEVWVMLARPGQDPCDLLWSGNDHSDTVVPRVCRAVLSGGVLVLGYADPEDDPLLSELLRGEDSGTA